LNAQCSFTLGAQLPAAIADQLVNYTPTAQLCSYLSGPPCNLASTTYVTNSITTAIDNISFCVETSGCGYLYDPGSGSGGSTLQDLLDLLVDYVLITELCTVLAGATPANCGLQSHVEVCHAVGSCFNAGTGCPT